MWAQSSSMVALEWINDASQRELDSNRNIYRHSGKGTTLYKLILFAFLPH